MTLQMIQTSLRTDIESGFYVSELQWRTFIAPPLSVVLPALNIAIQTPSFWRVMAQRPRKTTLYFNIELAKAQRIPAYRFSTDNKTIFALPVALELKILREVCSDFRKYIPVFKAAQLMTRNLYCTTQHVERRFGISRRRALELKRYNVHYNGDVLADVIHMPEVFDMLRSINIFAPIEHTLKMHSIRAKTTKKEWISHSQKILFKKLNLEKKKKHIQAWLASENMAICGIHMSFALNFQGNLEDVKPFVRRVYYIKQFLKKEYECEYSKVLNEQEQQGFNYHPDARETAIEKCGNMCLAVDFHVPWPEIWAKVVIHTIWLFHNSFSVCAGKSQKK